MKTNKSIEKMWKEYLKSIGDEENKGNLKCGHFFFGNEKIADNLAMLVKQGEKRATTALYYWYDVKGETMPEVGNIDVVTTFNKEAVCIIRTTKIEILPFKDVTEDHAFIEGEGDKSLKYWKDAHRDFYTNELKDEDIDFSEEMKVVFETFEVIYK